MKPDGLRRSREDLSVSSYNFKYVQSAHVVTPTKMTTAIQMVHLMLMQALLC
jgi:hypothetical protein